MAGTQDSPRESLEYALFRYAYIQEADDSISKPLREGVRVVTERWVGRVKGKAMDDPCVKVVM